MTNEIFRCNGYTFEFESNVLSIDGDKVILDSTAFYPGGGGQVSDTGYINKCRVEGTLYEGQNIVHIVPKKDFSVGDKVQCNIDWDRRYDLMQGHTGEHILFCSLKRECPDLMLSKIYISPESKYLIVNHNLTWEQIRNAVKFANSVIKDNLIVTKSIVDRSDLDLKKVRIKLERIPDNEQISVISIGDIDQSACSGIHVMYTGELEMLLVDRKISVGKDTMIQFKIGNSAKDAAIALASKTLEISDIVGCKHDDATRAVSNMKSKIDDYHKLIRDSTKQILLNIVPKNFGCYKIYSTKVFGSDHKTLMDFIKSKKSEEEIVVLIVVTNKLLVMFASKNQRINCKHLLSEVMQKFGGNGGGNSDFAQGGIIDMSLADNILEESVFTILRELRVSQLL